MRNMKDFSQIHEDQFFFYLQKFFQYLCSQESSLLNEFRFFKLN
jgi:hypothetical protein